MCVYINRVAVFFLFQLILTRLIYFFLPNHKKEWKKKSLHWPIEQCNSKRSTRNGTERIRERKKTANLNRLTCINRTVWKQITFVVAIVRRSQSNFITKLVQITKNSAKKKKNEQFPTHAHKNSLTYIW